MDNDEAVAQLRRVLEGLLERARKDEVRWQTEEARPGRRGAYLVKLPSSAIKLDFISPETEPDYYVAYLMNDKGTAVKRLTATEGDLPDWDLLSNLWNEAYRTTTGWDRALAEIDAAIKAPDPVGQDDDDIPF